MRVIKLQFIWEIRVNWDLLAAMTAGVVGRSEPIKAKIEAAVAVGVARDEPALVEVGALLTETVAAARALHYQPPDDPLWWTTVTGKIDALTPRDLRFAIGEIEALDTLSRNSTRLVTAISSQSENLESEIARLEAVFDEARQDIASAFGLSAGLPLSLDAVARWFPALLAAVFAGFIAWQASALGQLIFASSLRDDDKDGSTVIARLVSASGSAGAPFNRLRLVVLLAWSGLAVKFFNGRSSGWKA